MRLVYVGTCHGWDTTDEFIEAGAVTGIGSDTKMVNFPFYPLFIYNFAKLNKTAGTSTLLSDIMPDEDFKVIGDKSIRMNSND